MADAKQGKVNPDLEKERRNASFSKEELTCLLYGGKEFYERKKEIESLALNDEVLTKAPHYHFLSREEKYSESIRKAAYLVRRLKELDLTDIRDQYIFRQVFFPNEPYPTSLHLTMFSQTIANQGTSQQIDKWLPLAADYKILGTYAQTELGHGTHLRGLETTATYDPKTKEFIIHSPTTTSMKWWPGGMGKTTNYVVCMALLTSRGQNCGIQPFLVQTRHLQTHEPMPGITIGDIGPKFGYETVDNGFLKFDHVRIPRENMLMKNSEVREDGTFVDKSKGKKLAYGAMIFIRAMLVSDCARSLAMAATIATRYSCVRHQSELKPGAPEPQVMDYQTQQYKLLPLIATSFAFWFSGERMRNTYLDISTEIQRGNTDLLPELHGLSAGLKAFSSWRTMSGIEVCRLACGGHGYSQASGLPKIYVAITPACTYEGENTVMILQTARYLMKALDEANRGQKLSGSVSYLSDVSSKKCSINSDVTVESLLDAYKHRAVLAIRLVGDRLKKLEASGKEKYDAWNLTSVDLVHASTVHCHYFVVKTFADKLKEMKVSRSLLDVMTSLFKLYATFGIMENSGDFLLDNYMSSHQLDLIGDKLLELLSDVRRNAVALVDSFDFLDTHLQSVLGRYDGQVYENLYKWALESPLNKTQVHESYHKYLKPMFEEAKAKARL